MIGEIGANLAASSYRGNTARLTESQSAGLQKILSDYDPNNLSTSDAKDIVSQIKDLGIRPGAALAQSLNDAGFDPGELRQAAGLEGQRRSAPPPPPSAQTGGQIDQTAIDSLTSILENYDLTDLSDADQQNIQSQLNEAGFSYAEPGQIFDAQF